MKSIIFSAITLLLAVNLQSQTIKLSDKLTLTQLSEKTYIHTCNNNNGIVFINGKDALIVSTPDSDNETQNLIDWIVNEQEANIVGYVIDRWHPDAMEGLDIVHKNGIKTYAYELTRQIAKEKGLPIPQIGFDIKTVLQVGNEQVVCHFLGEAHTKDGIVVWIPGEQILFGGNGIRNFNGWIGNIADASLNMWSETAKNIKNEYKFAKIVVPGHGLHGGGDLIDHTIELYEIQAVDKSENIQDLPSLSNFDHHKDFIIQAASDSLHNGVHILSNATIIAQDLTKYVIVESSFIRFEEEKKRIDSETGRLSIYDKTPEGGKLRTSVSYKKLILLKKDDSVGLRIILKELIE